jgi:hypothetical protein
VLGKGQRPERATKARIYTRERSIIWPPRPLGHSRDRISTAPWHPHSSTAPLYNMPLSGQPLERGVLGKGHLLGRSRARSYTRDWPICPLGPSSAPRAVFWPLPGHSSTPATAVTGLEMCNMPLSGTYPARPFPNCKYRVQKRAISKTGLQIIRGFLPEYSHELWR